MHTRQWLATSSGNFQVHVFCDTSEIVYGAALYVRSTKEDKTLTCLACCKSRLAPVKRLTVPRLNLLVALVGKQLLHYFCTATSYDTNQTILWSDATVPWVRYAVIQTNGSTLSAIESRKCRHSRTPTQWRHCPGLDNSADHISRGFLGDHI